MKIGVISSFFWQNSPVKSSVLVFCYVSLLVIDTISLVNIWILGLDSKLTNNGKVTTTAKIEVEKQEDLTKVLRIIKDIKCVEDVFRVGR